MQRAAIANTAVLFLAFSMAETLANERVEHPNLAAMRAYRLSKLTDQQVLDLQRRSIVEFENYKQTLAESGKKWWREREERHANCEANPAAKLRDPNHCFEPLPIGFEDIGKPKPGRDSADKVFEELLMGICDFVSTVREAKEKGCLPP